MKVTKVYDNWMHEEKWADEREAEEAVRFWREKLGTPVAFPASKGSSRTAVFFPDEVDSRRSWVTYRDGKGWFATERMEIDGIVVTVRGEMITVYDIPDDMLGSVVEEK